MIEFIKIDGFTPDNFHEYIERTNKELNETIESGEDVYARDILERMGREWVLMSIRFGRLFLKTEMSVGVRTVWNEK